MIVRDRKVTLNDKLCTEALDEPIAVPNPLKYGDPLRDTSAWTAFNDVAQRFKSVADVLSEAGVFEESYEMSDDDLADALGRDRDAPWGFAVGDRVRMTALGYSGKVINSETCPFVNPTDTHERCRRICPNITFHATHRIGDDGSIENVTEGSISCPPADLEHCD